MTLFMHLLQFLNDIDVNMFTLQTSQQIQSRMEIHGAKSWHLDDSLTIASYPTSSGLLNLAIACHI